MTDIDITGRDRHVVSRALAWAITTIEQLPSNLRTVGDDGEAEEMRTILKTLVADENVREGWFKGIRLKISTTRNEKT